MGNNNRGSVPGARRFSRERLADMAMSVDTAAHDLLRDLPHVDIKDLKQYVVNLRAMMANWEPDTFGGTDLLVERILKAAPLALPKGLSVPGHEATLRSHVLMLIEHIIPAGDRFTMDFGLNSFGWAQMRDSLAAAHKKIEAANDQGASKGKGKGLHGVPAPLPAQLPGGNAIGMAGKKHVWAGERPTGFVGDEVADCLLEHADQAGLVGEVMVAGKKWKVKPYEGSAPQPSGQPRNEEPVGPGRRSAGAAATALGLRGSSVFTENYKRCAKKFLTDVYTNYENVESFLNAHYASLKNSEQAGKKIKFGQLLTSARTIDLMIIQHSEEKRTLEELYKNDVLEMHCGNIAREDYAGKSGNYEGAEAISGFGDFLLPVEAITQANTFTNSMAKLRNNLRNNTRTNNNQSKGSGKGNEWVPLEQRQCFECHEYGHLGKDCPKRKARLAKEAKAAGKGKNEKE